MLYSQTRFTQPPKAKVRSLSTLGSACARTLPIAKSQITPQTSAKYPAPKRNRTSTQFFIFRKLRRLESKWDRLDWRPPNGVRLAARRARIRKQGTLPDNNLVEIIGRIYEGAENPLVWTDALRLLGDEFGSFVNIGVVNDAASPLAQITATDGRDPKLLQEYNDHYFGLNFILPRLLPASPGRILSSADVCDDNDVLNSEFYQDFLRRLGVFYLLGCVISSTPTSSAFLTLARSREHGPWTSTEKRTLASLMPHLQRAARFSAGFATMRQERDDVLNRLLMGVIVLGESGKVEFSNQSADIILKTNDGLCCSSNRVSAANPSQAAQLRALISGAQLTASRKSMVGGGSMSLTRSSAGRPLSILVAPMMTNGASLLSQSPRVVLFITDPDSVYPTNLERLAGMFDLTPAESRMTDQLLQGKSLGDAAEELHITSQTARTHLKRIFGKTDTNRQSELMRVLLSSPVSLRN
jgi:DNA-binding CsgD family transcriptional regulator